MLTHQKLPKIPLRLSQDPSLHSSFGHHQLRSLPFFFPSLPEWEPTCIIHATNRKEIPFCSIIIAFSHSMKQKWKWELRILSLYIGLLEFQGSCTQHMLQARLIFYCILSPQKRWHCFIATKPNYMKKPTPNNTTPKRNQKPNLTRI